MASLSEKINSANEEAIKRLRNSKPKLVDICRVSEMVEGMHKKMILHAGPPVTWENMCGPVKGAVTGALVYEGVAENIEEAEKMAAAGEIEFCPCHHHGGVGPMAGVASYSMWAFKVKNEEFGNHSFCTLNEGLGKVLRFGANDESVIKKLKWMEEVLGPGLKKAIALADGGIDIKMMTANALHMGDECHNRNVAATSLFLKEVLPLMLKTDLSKEEVGEIYQFIADNGHFYLNLSMAACKCMADTISGLEYCTIMSVMARNGTELGIRIAGLGDRWFTAPAGMPKGLYFPGYSEEDANPDLGDSTISEVAGIGGFAMASAPAIVRFVGGTYSDALKYTNEMGEICFGRHTDYTMPTMNFQGTPLGVDLRKVIETGITPIINTGIAHKEPGIGQVGAGILYAPLSCFEEAFEAFNEKYGE
jgi:hypothetical protein